MALREPLCQVLGPGAGSARPPALPLAERRPDPQLRPPAPRGQAISTAFVESLVNSLLTKRFSKKQSMQCYPALSLKEQPAADNLLAA